MSTRKHHRFPYTDIILPDEAAVFNMRAHQIAYGFGYDSVRDDYKLVRIAGFCRTMDSPGQVMVYGLKSNWWKRVEGFGLDFLCPRPMSVFADGAVHWVVTVDLPDGHYWLIAAFDLAAEEFTVVQKPPGAGLGIWESRFCVILNCIGRFTDMWVMKHYGVEDSWVKLLSTSETRITCSSISIVPIAHLSNGYEVLLLKDGKEFLCYDLERNKVKNARIRGIPNSYDSELYVESLVSPLPPLVNEVDDTVGKHKSERVKKNAKKRDDLLSTGFKLVS